MSDSGMKVFASWSGEHSKEIAMKFADWLPNVIQGTDVFVSPRDIFAGESWLFEITQNLRDSNYGIAFVTKDNKISPWLQFESGALALKFDQARITPVLCNLTNTELDKRNPLSNFQAVELSEKGIGALLKSIHKAMDVNRLTENQLIQSYEKWKDEFFSEIKTIQKKYINTAKNNQASEKNNPNNSEVLDLERVLSDLVGEVRTLSTKVEVSSLNSKVSNNSSHSRPIEHELTDILTDPTVPFQLKYSIIRSVKDKDALINAKGAILFGDLDLGPDRSKLLKVIDKRNQELSDGH